MHDVSPVSGRKELSASKEQVSEMIGTVRRELDTVSSTQTEATQQLYATMTSASRATQDLQRQMETLTHDVAHAATSATESDAAVRQQVCAVTYPISFCKVRHPCYRLTK